MRLHKRNQRTLYYANLDAKTEKVDSFGNKTGQYALTYGPAKMLRANISAARGTLTDEQFGINERYTRTFVADIGCDIEKDTIIWILDADVVQLPAEDPLPAIHAGDIVLTTEGKLMRALTDNPSASTDYASVPHNYVVTQKAVSLHSVTYAIQEVNVS